MEEKSKAEENKEEKQRGAVSHYIYFYSRGKQRISCSESSQNVPALPSGHKRRADGKVERWEVRTVT